MGLIGGSGSGSGNKSAREIRGGQQAETMADVVRQQEEAIRKLTVLVQSLWMLAKDRLNLTDDDLNRMVKELSDQGRVSVAASCQQCGRPLEKRQSHCLYCGHEDTNRDVFSTLL